jgi:hypothetical protein
MAKKSKRKSRVGVGQELCVGSYTGQQIGHTVNLTATGGHPTTGYEVFLQQSPIDIFPPEFALYHRNPSGTVLDVITPFSISKHFVAAKPVKLIVVHDAEGAHSIKVVQASQEIQGHILKLHKDGPFPMGTMKPSAVLGAVSTIGGGVSAVWPNLVRLLTSWCQVAQPGLGDNLGALWLRTSGGLKYPDAGIPALLKALKSDLYFGTCPYRQSITAGRLLGDLKTVKNLYDALYPCGLT